ncbi:hypothetical protein [Acetobacter sp. DmW_136]|nr:hypothetical protein [Acetobacter sp. DmW_136]
MPGAFMRRWFHYGDDYNDMRQHFQIGALALTDRLGYLGPVTLCREP